MLLSPGLERGRTMIRELDTVVLKRDIQEQGLTQGDVGAVVHRYRDRGAFEVEFVTAEGKTVAVLTLAPGDIRPMHGGEILHARALAGPSQAPTGSYRRKKGSDTWHWCRNCSSWPTSGYEESIASPANGELCNECRAKEVAGSCS